MVDLSAIARLRHARESDLVDRQGMESLLPFLGLCGGTMLYPPELRRFRDRGLQHMQMPNQFAPYLIAVGGLKVRRYCEIGVKYGGTFVITAEYLRRLCGLDCACAIDINFCPSLVKYSRKHRDSVFRQMDSKSPDFVDLLHRTQFDLVFVDGDHEERACYDDIKRAVACARHVAVHDISNDYTPGPGNAWRRMKADFAAKFLFHEFTEQYPAVLAETGHRVLGIGLAERIA
jgi:cephalosporin hydroxylase